MRRPLFAVLCGAAAAVWLTILFIPWSPGDYEPFRGREVCLEGRVCGLEPKIEGDSLVWRMTMTGVTFPEETSGDCPVLGKKDCVLCVLEREPAVKMSARARVRGRIYPFRSAMNEGEFDARLYDHILRVEFQLRDTRILAVSAPADRPAAFLYECKKSISSVIDRLFSNQNSPVVKAMLLGEKGLLEEETKELYQGAGIIHILSISGLHLSLLGMGLFLLLGKIRLPLPGRPARRLSTGLSLLRPARGKRALSGRGNRRAGFQSGKDRNPGTCPAIENAQIKDFLRVKGKDRPLAACPAIPLPVRSAASILLVFLYGKMTGMGTSAFRALVMLALFFVAKALGRTYDLLTAAAIAWTLLLFDQPLYLLHTGFQFSFCAVLSIGILLPALPGKALKALAVPLGTLPVYLWNYGTFPLYSLLLNLLVIPLMGLMMVSSGAAVAAGEILSRLGGAGYASAGAALSCVGGTQNASAGGFLPRLGGVRYAAARAMLAQVGGTQNASAGAFLPRLGGVRTAADFMQTLRGAEGGFLLPARILALPADLILDFYRFLASLSEKLPGHAVVLGRPSPVQILLYYGLLLAFAGLSARLRSPAVRRLLEHGAGSEIFAGLSAHLRVPALFCRILRYLKGISAFGLRDNRERKRFAAVSSAVWILLCILVLTFRRAPAFEMDFLYVGQGDGIFISSGGRNYLVDGGSSSNQELVKYTLLPFFHCKGIRRLDAAMVTHEDKDHCSGILELLKSASEGAPDVEIGALYLTDIEEEAKGENYRRMEELAASAKIPVFYISRGDCLRSGKLTFTCLHPAKGAVYEDANQSSMTLLLEYGEEKYGKEQYGKEQYGTGEYGKEEYGKERYGKEQYGEEHFEEETDKNRNLDRGSSGKAGAGGKKGSFSALLTGDLEGQGEEDLIRYLKSWQAGKKNGDENGSEEGSDKGSEQGSEKSGETGSAEDRGEGSLLHIDILKAAHHGSRNASSEAFLDQVCFEQAVISAGIGNVYGHPHEELLERIKSRGADCLRTDLEGEIRIRAGERGR